MTCSCGTPSGMADGERMAAKQVTSEGMRHAAALLEGVAQDIDAFLWGEVVFDAPPVPYERMSERLHRAAADLRALLGGPEEDR